MNAPLPAHHQAHRFDSIERLDIRKLRTTEPPPLDHLWQGGPLGGTVGAVVSRGGVGKSFVALGVAFAVTTGGQFDPLALHPKAGGRVVIASLEDPDRIIHPRLFSYLKRCAPRAAEQIDEGLDIYPLAGQGGLRLAQDLMDTDYLIRIAEGARLLIIDTLVRAHQLNENDNGAMAGVVAQLEIVARETGASVLYLHHAAKFSGSKEKDGGSDDAAMARGASSLIDNARWCWTLRVMSEPEAKVFSEARGGKSITDDERSDRKDFLLVTPAKNNYGPMGSPFWLARGEGGGLWKAELFPAAIFKDEKGDKNEG